MIWTPRMGYSRFPSPPAAEPPKRDELWQPDDEEDDVNEADAAWDDYLEGDVKGEGDE